MAVHPEGRATAADGETVAEAEVDVDVDDELEEAEAADEELDEAEALADDEVGVVALAGPVKIESLDPAPQVWNALPAQTMLH